MDIAKESLEGLLLTTGHLAAMEQFTLGGVIVSPSTRALRGPNASVDVEPRVMQVLVVLAAAAGQVVTRETLFNRCWGGVYVGDDSLNRAVAALRRAVATVGGRFEVETIPRTGYLLTVPKGDGSDEAQHSVDRQSAQFSRRNALIAGSAVAALGGTAVWWTAPSRSDAQFDALMERNHQALLNGSVFGDASKFREFEEAIRVRPGSAKAWGLLALVKSMMAQGAAPTGSASAVEEAEAAARKALVLYDIVR